MNVKDTVNKVSGITTLCTFAILSLGYILENDSLFGFPNAIVLYALMSTALIWFGTRKNGCGSCNQTPDISKSKRQSKD